MNRFDTVLNLPGIQPSLPDIALLFFTAVKEAAAEGLNPNSDPAVVLLGSHIAFQVHADLATPNMYSTLIDACAEEAEQRGRCVPN